MFSDVVGYTAIMGRDEQQALRALKDHRELLRLLLPKFNGRMVGEIGDGTLTSFHSAIDAVNCAREVQASLQQDQPDLKVRIGIHLGDVVFSEQHGAGRRSQRRVAHSRARPSRRDLRLGQHLRRGPQQAGHAVQGPRRAETQERVAPDTGVSGGCERPHRAAGRARGPPAPERAHRRRGCRDIGRARPGVRAPEIAGASPSAAQSAAKRTISSIAVLPLDNYSGDPNQEYFTDGMTDELTTDLATISALRVISRGSVMQYKGAHRPPTPEIAKALNVDAVVEGSVMRIGDKVRDHGAVDRRARRPASVGEELRARLARRARAAGRTRAGDRERDQRATDTQRADALDQAPRS